MATRKRATRRCCGNCGSLKRDGDDMLCKNPEMVFEEEDGTIAYLIIEDPKDDACEHWNKKRARRKKK